MKRFQWTTEKELLRWERERERGPFVWILHNGVMAWGASMFLMMTLFRAWFYGKEMISRDELMGTAGIWLISGALYGLALWLWSERSYKRAVGRRDALQ
jgi:hypothetical protein